MWALLDENLGVGKIYDGNHLDPAAAKTPQGNPPRIPIWLTSLLFGALYLLMWNRPLYDNDLRTIVRFTAITLVLFFLWLRGWSPQWLAMLVPFLLLALPLERAVMYIVVLNFANLVEALLLQRGLDMGLHLTVPMRTLVFLSLLVELGLRSLITTKQAASYAEVGKRRWFRPV
ncbi:MAG: hypothetical protein DRI79_12925 [Chloroflexi bacterium]|nr:MAG: hypothetical protein DRI79_12925 [Chloroflexota bacterium]